MTTTQSVTQPGPATCPARTSSPIVPVTRAYNADGTIAGVIQYRDWPTTGDANPLTIVNTGSGSTTFNGTAVDNDYALLPSGATSFHFDTNADYVSIPAGLPLSGPHTLEVYLTPEAIAAAPDVFFTANYGISLAGDHYIYIWRSDASATNFAVFVSDNPVVYDGVPVYIQLTWDAPENTPLLRVNGVSEAVTNTGSALTTWYNADATTSRFGVRPDASQWLIGTVYLWRFHSEVLTPTELTAQYNADKLRVMRAYNADGTIKGVVQYRGVTGTTDWPATNGGATVTNSGTAGSAYNATMSDQDNGLTLSSGATGYNSTDSTDVITIPAGAAVKMAANQVTIEAIINFAALPSVGTGWTNIFSKLSSSLRGTPFWFCITSTGAIEVGIYDTTITNVKAYNTADATIAINTWYNIQVTWDLSGAVTTAPTIYVNNVSQSLTAAGAGTTFYNDSAVAGVVGYGVTTAPNTYDYLQGEMILLRVHQELLTPTELSAQYTADTWRYLAANDAWTETVTPTCTTTVPVFVHNVNVTETIIPSATTATPSTMKGIGFSETTVPTATTTVYSPTITIISNVGITTVPTGTTAATIPDKTVISNILITTVPNCTTTTLEPSLGAGQVWAQTAVPTATADDYAVVKGITQTETTVPTATTATPSAVKGIGKTETTVPTGTTATITPAKTVVSNIVITTTPTATADDYAVTNGIGFSEVTIPTATTAAITPDKTVISNILITTVPTCTTIAIAPSPAVSETWVQTAVPTATADDYAVVKGVGITETIIPSAIADDYTLAKGIGKTETTVPTATADEYAPALTVISNIAITIVPTATADDYSIVKGIGITETTVPTATADEYAPYLRVISNIVITTIPTATADDYTVTKNIGKTETTVPTGTTASPSVVKGVGITETIIPSATADDYTVAKGIGKTETTVPTGTTAAIAPVKTVISNIVITIVPTAAADDYAVAKGIGKTETTIPTCITTTPTISKGGRVTVIRPTATTTAPSVMVVLHIRFDRKTSRVVGTLPATTARMPGTLPATTARMPGTLPATTARMSGTLPATTARMLGTLQLEEII
jgi:hypothetical protein